MIAIIDYDAGNIRSVEKALILLGKDVKVTGDRNEILAADKVILPGVGGVRRRHGNHPGAGAGGSDPSGRG